ncbi:hypothetical protein VIGAN_08199800 [Vigna angularis var. angularis]|uniref:Uncharacterized protein n=1 Tax=Vigna angularis var. angularis TaxID=157739 RepID=A0A0S3SR39_PHAAN|nr:hypothetical protein VIGAN_08199800 [Vigna angularis var. angularis]
MLCCSPRAAIFAFTASHQNHHHTYSFFQPFSSFPYGSTTPLTSRFQTILGPLLMQWVILYMFSCFLISILHV